MNRWLSCALRTCARSGQSYALCVRVVGVAEMMQLNRDYRGVIAPTNVLAFPAHMEAQNNTIYLGDIAVCGRAVACEARDHNIPVQRRWAHVLVHGLLHLLGYDHIRPPERCRMEAIERRIMRHLGYPNPYLKTPPRRC